MYAASSELDRFDPQLYQAIEGERKRQEQHIELIASENTPAPGC